MMATHHSADARTALMATYIARYTNPWPGMRFTPAVPCSARSKECDGDKGRGASAEGFGGSFGARGRTIYNADTSPMHGASCGRKGGGKGECAVLKELERIDAEEAQRRKCKDEFLMAARGDFEESTPSEEVIEVALLARVEELFALYTHI